MVEQGTENPRVIGPIPILATISFKPVFRDTGFFRFHAQNPCWNPLSPALFPPFRRANIQPFCYSATISLKLPVSPPKLDTANFTHELGNSSCVFRFWRHCEPFGRVIGFSLNQFDIWLKMIIFYANTKNRSGAK